MSQAAPAWAQPASVSDFPPHDYSVVSTPGHDGGRALVQALRVQPPRAAALETLLQHGYVEESLTVLSRIVDAGGPELLPGLKAAARATRWWRNQERNKEINLALATILEAAAAVAARRPRDEAAEIAREVLQLRLNMLRRGSRTEQTAALREFIAKHEGTPAALVAEFELLTATLTIAQQVDASERFAREHPGTIAGARALYHAGFQLGTNYATTGVEPRGSDPTNRLLRVARAGRRRLSAL